MQARNNLFISSSPLLRQAIIRSGRMRAASDELASRLAAIAEGLYTSRAVEPLREAAELLAGLPEPRAKAAGLFYQAMCECIAGSDERAEPLLRAVAGMDCAPRFQARALQSLGVIYRLAHDHAEAVNHYRRAIQQAEKCQDFITILRAGMTLSDISTLKGDHSGALRHLASIRPVVELAAQVAPVYAPMWCNNVAVDLAGLGRFEEARKFVAYAISSPFASAYPEWRETAQEIEQAREAIAAHKSILRAVAMPARSKARKQTPRTLFLLRKLTLKATRRRSQPRTSIFTRELPRSRPTLEQVSLKIKIRAPSFASA